MSVLMSAERKRVDEMICLAYTREQVLAAMIGRSEFLRRHPNDWDITEMGEVLSHRQDYFNEEDAAAAIAAGKDPNWISPEKMQFKQALRNLYRKYEGPASPASLIEDYQRGIARISSIRFQDAPEQSEADYVVRTLREFIERLRQDLITGMAT